MVDKNSPSPVRVRFAPSPTGSAHIGSVRTALFNWLFARKMGGTFILRIEDTDKERSEKKYETEMVEALTWLGLNWDEGPEPTGGAQGQLELGGEQGDVGPYRQSERTEVYKKYLQQLIDSGDAYYCYCNKDDIEAQRQGMLAQGLPPKYNGHCRDLTEPPAGKSPEVIRFKTPEVKVEFKDLVRGKVIFDASLFGDMIIAKNLDSALYNFTVVIDDALMKITHVIRGEDHLSNTPKQILIGRALTFIEPTYAHIPLILNSDRSKMSKRFSDTALLNYQGRGYLPETLINFLVLLGWHPKGDKEVLSVKEIISEFDLERVQQSGAIFNEDKLDWLNREHMKLLAAAEIVKRIEPFFIKNNIAIKDEMMLLRAISVQLNRAKTLDELAQLSAFFFILPDYDPKLLIWKDATTLTEVGDILLHVKSVFEGIVAEDFTREHINNALQSIIGDKNRGLVLWPLRVSLSGLQNSPDPIEIMEVIGKEESLRRIETALQKIQQ